MTNLSRVLFVTFRRFRRSKHALVTSIGVILLVYVILASDVIPELKPFKPRSVFELRIKPSTLPISLGEAQSRHGLSAQEAGKLPKGLLSHNQTRHRPTKPRNVFHFPPEDPPPSASGSRASANQTSMVPSHGHSSGSNNNNNSRSSSSDSIGQNVVDTVNNTSSENVPSNNIVDSSNMFQRDSKNDKPDTGDSVVVNMKQAGSSEVFKGGHSEETVRAKDEAEDSSNRKRPGSSILLAGVPKDRKVFLTVGMVTVKRDKADYFFNTLDSLLQHSSPDEQRQLTIVVMLADRDQSRIDQVLQSIKERYHVLLQSGLLLVIRGPNTDFIFRNSDVKRTYDDSLQRVQWRSKQNLDYAAVIEFCANLSTYYLHVEDDVLSADSYIRHIRDFINANRKVIWAILEVCPHGFIGKLFKTVDLPKLVTVLRTFYLEQPCDFLINYFMRIMTQPKPIVRPSPLFYHQGKYSSLFNVTRKLDKVPGKKGKKVQVAKVPQSRSNPMAEVSSDLKIWDNHGVYNAYSLQTSDFLWASGITAGQRYTVTFVSEQRLKKLVIDTGFSEQDPRDRLFNGRVDMGTKPPTSSHPLHCPDAKTVGKFQEGHFDVILVPPHGIRCFSIVITENQKEWLIIREIQVYTE